MPYNNLISWLTFPQWMVLILAAFIIGISKAGISSISIITASWLAIIFGSKQSTGVVLPMLCIADVLAVLYYKRNANKNLLLKLMPWVFTGILIATWLGNKIDNTIFKPLMSILILVSAISLLWFKKKANFKIPTNPVFAAAMGFSTGFTTMIGNIAGAFSNIYFMAMQLPKATFIGTTAWLFLIINLIKLPLHIYSWQTINKQTIVINLYMIPAIVSGFYFGTYIVKKLNEEKFKLVIIWLTILSSLFLLF